MNANSSNPLDSDRDVPPRLTAGLRRLESRQANVPDAVDEAMRQAIRAHFTRSATAPARRRRMAPWLWAAGGIGALGGVAAVIALAGRLGLVTPPTTTTPPAQIAKRQPADVDGNDRIDILDAFALARQLQSNQRPSDAAANVDINADGAVDQRDVDAIAMQAVALTPREASGQRGRSS